MAFDKYYRQELALLREYAADFGREYPSIAPMLSGPEADPDVERLLEGVAYLTANIQRRLDEAFPEVLHTLLQMVAPHYLRPLPSTTIMAFTPRANLRQTLKVPAGTAVDSVPVDGTPCRFRTIMDMDVMPLTLKSAERIEATRGGAVTGIEIKMQLDLNGLSLDAWDVETLRFHIAGDYAEAADLYLLMTHLLEGAEIRSNDGVIHRLRKKDVRPGGFSDQDALVPYPANVFPSYRLIQEYFQFPRKFLFLELDLSQWKNRGAGSSFTLTLNCALPSFSLPKVDANRFEFNAVPAANLFDHVSDPIIVNHERHEVPVEPAGEPKTAYQVFSVDQVTGLMRGSTNKRDFQCFTDRGGQDPGGPVYNTVVRTGLGARDHDVLLSVAYPPKEELPDQEIVSCKITCTNGSLPDALQVGDIRIATSNTPELIDYKNIVTPTSSQPPPLEGDRLWHLLSHMTTNMLSIGDAQSLRDLLRLYLFPEPQDKAREIANQRRINGIVDVKLKQEERLIGQAMVRGQSIELTARNDHFAGPGDLYLFGNILDRFFATSSAINHYTVLRLHDEQRGETTEWPARLGERPLL